MIQNQNKMNQDQDKSSYPNGRKIRVEINIDVFHQNKVSGSDLSWIVEFVGRQLRLGAKNGKNDSTNTPYKFTYIVLEKSNLQG